MPLFPEKPTAWLALADGTLFEGQRIGAAGKTIGEVVFTTNMTGYQEVLTDPSYKGQMVTMTYPLQGNYGFRDDEAEAPQVMVEGFIVGESCPTPSPAGALTLDAYLTKAGIPGISGLDTRYLTRRLRSDGVVPGILSTEPDTDADALLAEAKSLDLEPDPRLVNKVTARERREESATTDAPHYHVVALDFGMKASILRYLREQGCNVTVVPAETSAADIRALKPDGLFLSNGPGDPSDLADIARDLAPLTEEYPTFGICLGHQVMGLAHGAKTFKLKFGHRGGNHPIKDLDENKILITTQNHGYAIDEASLEGTDLRLTHVNLNDRTVAGVALRDRPCFSVQFHPEAAPGPHDAHYLFVKFRNLLDEYHAQKN